MTPVPGNLVECIDSSDTGRALKKGETYVVSRISNIGYVFLDEVSSAGWNSRRFSDPILPEHYKDDSITHKVGDLVEIGPIPPRNFSWGRTGNLFNIHNWDDNVGKQAKVVQVNNIPLKSGSFQRVQLEGIEWPNRKDGLLWWPSPALKKVGASAVLENKKEREKMEVGASVICTRVDGEAEGVLEERRYTISKMTDEGYGLQLADGPAPPRGHSWAASRFKLAAPADQKPTIPTISTSSLCVSCQANPERECNCIGQQDSIKVSKPEKAPAAFTAWDIIGRAEGDRRTNCVPSLSDTRSMLHRVNEILDALENGDCIEDYTDFYVRGVVRELSKAASHAHNVLQNRLETLLLGIEQ